MNPVYSNEHMDLYDIRVDGESAGGVARVMDIQCDEPFGDFSVGSVWRATLGDAGDIAGPFLGLEDAREAVLIASPESLHLWRLGPDWVIASSVDDVYDVEHRFTGCPRYEWEDHDPPERLGPGEIVGMHMEHHDIDEWMRPYVSDHPEWGGYVNVNAPASEWLKHNGRKVLCSTEW